MRIAVETGKFFGKLKELISLVTQYGKP